MTNLLSLNELGKGTYLWQATKLKGGDPISIANYLAEARVDHVAIKMWDAARTVERNLHRKCETFFGKGYGHLGIKTPETHWVLVFDYIIEIKRYGK